MICFGCKEKLGRAGEPVKVITMRDGLTRVFHGECGEKIKVYTIELQGVIGVRPQLHFEDSFDECNPVECVCNYSPCTCSASRV